MKAVAAELLGGPWDGCELMVPGDDGGNPERVLVVLHTPPVQWITPEPREDVTLGVRRGCYDLRVSPRDEGPLWQYTWRGDE